MSDAMVPLVAAAGFTWMATDELILAQDARRDLHPGRPRAGRAARAALHAVSRRRPGGARSRARSAITCCRISSASPTPDWAAEAAADDFVAPAGRRPGGGTPAAPAGERPLIPIILDGENAWEHFEGGGRPFLRALYRRLSGHPELRTVTMAEACADGRRTSLPAIFPGSWIDANFYIWIGHRGRPARLEPAGRRARTRSTTPPAVDAASARRRRARRC